MSDPFNGMKWNPSRRYIVEVSFGDGGEMNASAWPECISDESLEPIRSSHTWRDWVRVEIGEGTLAAITLGIKQADKWWEEVYGV